MDAKPRRVFTKTVCVLDPYGKTFCGLVAKLCNKPYCLVKIGRVVAVEGADDPTPKSYILQVEQVGAYRIQDGQDTISIMITMNGVEATVERWEEWKFESLSAVPLASLIMVGGKRTDAEVKYAKGMGLVAPYTKNEMDKRDIPELPGVLPSAMGLKELREKLRNEREQQRNRDEPSTSAQATTAPKEVESWQQLQANIETVTDWSMESPAVVKDDSEHDDEDEEGGEYLTGKYMKKVSAVVKNPDPVVLGMAFGYPKTSGPFDKILGEKECQWSGVPVYDIDRTGNTYRLVMIGNATKYLFVVKGQNYFVLPAGGSSF
uniref:Non-structural protein NS2 n=1 Tax=Changuinola virus TaxID=40052 RepID=W5QLX2_9REOV|nr:NS2 [Changuinola virus]